MKKKKTLEDEINDFLEYWDADQMSAFLRDIIPLFELYDVENEDDWVKDIVGEEDERNVRLIRTVYLVSRIAEFHAGKLASIKMNFKDIYKKMEKKTVKENVGEAKSAANMPLSVPVDHYADANKIIDNITTSR